MGLVVSPFLGEVSIPHPNPPNISTLNGFLATVAFSISHLAYAFVSSSQATYFYKFDFTLFISNTNSIFSVTKRDSMLYKSHVLNFSDSIKCLADAHLKIKFNGAADRSWG